MKKLLINGLLILVFIFIIVAVIMALSRLRAVDETEEDVNEILQTQEQAIAEEKQIIGDTEVKVTVSNATTNAATQKQEQKTVETTSNDDDVSDFLSSLE